MAIPDCQTLIFPFLPFLVDAKEHALGEAVEALSTQDELSTMERQQLLPSGQQTTVRNRVGWSSTYMSKAGLIDPVRLGLFWISTRGKSALSSNPKRIDAHFLEQFLEFVAFRDSNHKETREVAEPHAPAKTPEEALYSAYQRPLTDLESEILQKAKTASPC